MDIHQMDFHYHAGQERKNKTLRQHLEHAAVTGRRIIGITDHYGRYSPNFIHPGESIYERSIKGLLDYYNELDELRSEFNILTLYFAPELGSSVDYDGIPDEVHNISDFYICEPTHTGWDMKENTGRLLERLAETAEFSRKVNKPVLLAHPFREAVNLRLVRNPIDPAVTNMSRRESIYKYSVEEVNDFFMLDVVQLGKAAAKYDIPVEVNGETHNRIRVTNLPGPLQLLWAAYAIMKEQGAGFVPGSDQHDFSTGRYGAYVPYDCFDAMGVKAEDIKFRLRLPGLC